MKKIIFLFFFSALFLGGYAQKEILLTTNWSTAGNAGILETDFIGPTNCAPLIFKTRNIERMRLLHNHSRLGIGFTNPQASLHLHFQEDISACNSGGGGVHGGGDDEESTTTSTNTGAPNRRLLRMTTPETGTASHRGFSAFYSGANITFNQLEQGNFFIEGPGGGLTISPDGRIGIGTNTPLAKLDVRGSFSAGALFATSADISNYLTAITYTLQALILVNTSLR